MTITLTLTDGTTSIDLYNTTAHTVRPGGLIIGAPERFETWGGNSSQRDGKTLVSVNNGTLPITILDDISGSTADEVETNYQAVAAMLRRGSLATTDGWGAQVQLQYKANSSSTTYYFDVLSGFIERDHRVESALLQKKFTMRACVISLTCQPYAYGPISESHENYIANPSFELDGAGGGAPGDSWAEYNSGPGGGVLTFETADCIYGLQSLKILHNAGGDYYGTVCATFACASAESTGRISLYGKIIAPGETFYIGIYDVTNSAWINSGILEWGAADSSWTRKTATFTKPVTCVAFWVRLYFAGSAGATILVDGLYLHPSQANDNIFWLSSRNLINHRDNGIGHINYLDIYAVPGTEAAELRLAGSAGEYELRSRGDPDLYVHNYEAEDGALGTGVTSVADATYASAGYKARKEANPAADWVDTSVITVNSNLVQQGGKVRVLLFWIGTGAGTATFQLRVLLRYGATPLNVAGKESTVLSSSTAATHRGVHDCGVFHIPPVAVPRNGEANEYQWVIQHKIVVGDPAGIYLYVDNIEVLPVEEGYCILTDDNVLDSIVKPPSPPFCKLVTATDDSSDYSQSVETMALGQPLLVEPTKQNRIYWRSAASNCAIATTAALRAKIRPRYRI